MPREGKLLAQAGSHSQEEPGIDLIQMDALPGQPLSYLHIQKPGIVLAPGK